VKVEEDPQAKPEEEKKEEEVVKGDEGKVDYEKIARSEVEKKPWNALLFDDDSEASKLVKGALGKFDKFNGSLMSVFSQLLAREKPFSSAFEILGESKVIVLAIVLQNAIQAKNSQRVDAIKENKYVEIRTLEDAEAYLGKLLHSNLTNELLSVESEV